MARETKAQRLEREAAERLAYRNEFLSSYPQRLLNLVYEYGNKAPDKFSVDRLEGTKFILETSVGWEQMFTLPAVLTEYDDEVACDVRCAEEALVAYQHEREEEQRRSLVRRQALEKMQTLFNDEERELLGM